MDLKTEFFDRYIQSWEDRIVELMGFVLGIEQNIEKANTYFSYLEKLPFDHFYKIYNKAKIEARKNLALMLDINQINLYRNYVNKGYKELEGGLIKIIKEDYESSGIKKIATRKTYSQINAQPPFKKWFEVQKCLHITLGMYWEDFEREKQLLNDEFADEIAYRNNQDIKSSDQQLQKFKWLGTPAQLAFIINLLQVKGYIEELTPFGERNARIILSHFDINTHKPTPESLGRHFQQLKNDVLPINAEDASKFQRIPKRVDLKK